MTRNYQQAQYAAGFKKGYSILLQATKKYLSENETFYPEGTSSWNRAWQTDFNQYVKSTKIENVNYESNNYKTYNGKISPVWNNGGVRWQLASGETFQLDVWLYEQTRIWYDLNGKKGPNRLGFDIFIFVLDDEKGAVPLGAPGFYVTGDCKVNSSAGNRNGTQCAYKAATDPNYFKNLP